MLDRTETQTTSFNAIKISIEKALTRQSNFIPKSSHFYRMETERLTDLLQEWIEMDLKRPEFKVLSMENKVTLKIAGLELNLRVDRMDESQDGHTLLIDYKTGKASPAGWFHERIQDPQLPLYHLHLHANTVLFAQIRKGNCSYKGVAQSASGISGVAVVGENDKSGFGSWDDLTEAWDARL